MGADWYTTTLLYGCVVSIPSNSTHIRVLMHIEKVLRTTTTSLPIHVDVKCLLTTVHSRMEGMDYYEHNEMTERSDIIIGFYPSDDLSKLMELSEQLKAFLASEAFAKFTFNPPSFHAGVEWYPREEDDEDNEYEESEDEEDIIPSIPAKPPAKTTAKSLSAEELHAMFYSS